MDLIACPYILSPFWRYFLEILKRFLRLQSIFLLSYVSISVPHANLIADVQAPRTSKGVLRSGRSFGKDSPMGHWQSIIESLNTILCTLKENFVRSKTMSYLLPIEY